MICNITFFVGGLDLTNLSPGARALFEKMVVEQPGTSGKFVIREKFPYEFIVPFDISLFRYFYFEFIILFLVEVSRPRPMVPSVSYFGSHRDVDVGVLKKALLAEGRSRTSEEEIRSAVKSAGLVMVGFSRAAVIWGMIMRARIDPKTSLSKLTYHNCFDFIKLAPYARRIASSYDYFSGDEYDEMANML